LSRIIFSTHGAIDFAGLMLSPKVRLEKAHIKAYLKQLLEGLHYLHTQKIL
jgi:serine/threonine protein kinase